MSKDMRSAIWVQLIHPQRQIVMHMDHSCMILRSQGQEDTKSYQHIKEQMKSQSERERSEQEEWILCESVDEALKIQSLFFSSYSLHEHCTAGFHRWENTQKEDPSLLLPKSSNFNSVTDHYQKVMGGPVVNNDGIQHLPRPLQYFFMGIITIFVLGLLIIFITQWLLPKF